MTAAGEAPGAFGSIAEEMAAIGPEHWDAIAAGLSESELEVWLRHWGFWERDFQCVPPEPWRVWLILAGRGAGKTRMGAEWVRRLAERDGRLRFALVGATIAETRAVMVEGESGLLSIATRAERPKWEPSIGRLTWRSGARGFVYSAENPESLRGPQHHHAWCDEIAKWPRGEAAWDNLRLGLRRGARPKIVATTTPRAVPLLKRVMREAAGAVTRGRTADNLALPADYIAAVEASYAGTRLGRQELDGELIEEAEGALWTRALIERVRVRAAPEIARVVVGVDPPAGTLGDGAGGDACGIVAVALGRDGHAYVIEDASVQAASPEGWARAVAACVARHGADRVVVESNNGGAMVESVLLTCDPAMPVRRVHASRGKAARAEPVSALYERGRAFHAGAFPALEDEMCGLIAGGGYQGPGRSPDRADALVWAMSELMLGVRGMGRVRVL